MLTVWQTTEETICNDDAAEKADDPSTAPSHGWGLQSQRLTPEFINNTWNERESSE